MSHQIKEISKFFISEVRQKMLINSIKEHTQDSQKRGYLISVLLDVLKKKQDWMILKTFLFQL